MWVLGVESRSLQKQPVLFFFFFFKVQLPFYFSRVIFLPSLQNGLFTWALVEVEVQRQQV